MSDLIGTQIDARGVARLTLQRPERHNALSGEMIDGLAEAARRLGGDRTVRVVVLEAEGPTFCAGGDLGWMQQQIGASPETRRTEARRLAHMLRDLNALPKPLIARVQGNAFGGGVGLCSVCDVVVADQSAVFGLTETRLGLIPATIGPYVLARIGQGAARRFFVSSERFGAAVAHETGLVSTVVAPGALDDAVAEQVDAYLSCAPEAMAAAKALALTDAPHSAQVEASIDALIAQWEGPEAQGGIAAFFERRPPPWAAGCGAG